MTRFYLGTHMPNWLATLDVPLFVSHNRLRRRRRLPVARTGWALDSGGFTELRDHGGWRTEPPAYVDACRRYMAEVGRLEWAAPMDWMCEPPMLVKTGRTVAEHQALTVDNLLELRRLAPDVPFVPVLQGWTIADYIACIDRYAVAGVDLTDEPVVGVGSVCRRQSTREIAAIFVELDSAGIRCHGFGVKTAGLAIYGAHLVSADSMAWSYDARRSEPLPGCTHSTCANCSRWALRWRERLLPRIAVRRIQLADQLELWDAA